MSNYMLEMSNISKSFPGVKALDQVNLKVKKGEVHALIGENGAGKSTLMKVLSGLYEADEGEVLIDGEPVCFENTQDAIDHGIATIYQELSLVPHLNAIENVMLGHEVHKYNFIQKKEEAKEARKWLDYAGQGALDPKEYTVPVHKLSVAQQQIVDIAKGLSYNAKIIIMDEPTDTLTEREITVLFEIVNKLKKDGITVIYISHRLEELFEICDRITVLRDGVYIVDEDVSEVDKNWLINRMIGRDLVDTFPEKLHECATESIMKVENLSGERFKNVSFDLKKGEILGFSGLVGSGRTELMRAIFGADRTTGGNVYIDGELANYTHPSQAVRAGMGFATEDRKTQGLFLNMDISENVAIASIGKYLSNGLINENKIGHVAEKYVSSLRIVTPSIAQTCKNLSGGNQQKVVLAKWLATECNILILDEPTRGIDVGAKHEIYVLMEELANSGVSIIMISSEMPEILGISDRIVVMHEGRITGMLSCEEASEKRIMMLASG